jgi:membrane fusion protein, adhesin transport system
MKYLHGVDRSLEDDERFASRVLVWSVTLLLVLGLIWASLFKLDEVTRAQGKIIPSSREQVIQSLDTGVLVDMLVKEGDQVQQGQVLLRIDDARSGPVFREAQEKFLALLAQSARLRAEAYGSELIFPQELSAHPTLRERETQAFDARKQALDEHLSALRNSLSAITQEINLTAPLVNQGVMSKVELLRLRRQQSDLQGQIAERRNRYLTDANAELSRVESELSQTRENALAREDAFKRTTIRSPMKGIVKNVTVTTIGGVIQAGQSIMEIVPVHDEMLVEAYVKPAEVAYLRIGQPAIVKLTAYDFNKYGGLNGVLEHLSPDTLRDESKAKRPGASPVELEEGYYRILVRIEDSGREKNGMNLTPMPGMTTIVELPTGEKTVLEYLIRPLQSVTQALRER